MYRSKICKCRVGEELCGCTKSGACRSVRVFVGQLHYGVEIEIGVELLGYSAKYLSQHLDTE